jgi:hypothetical protein
MKIQNRQYRQGDVLLERIGSLPKKLQPVDREHGKVVLAHGEVTGHAHTLAEPGTRKLVDGNGAEYFDIKGHDLRFNLPLVRRWKDQVMVDHPELGKIEFSIHDVKIVGDRVIAAGEFGLLKHDEHATQGVPAGLYRGAGATGTVHQREYSPEEIRRVAD